MNGSIMFQASSSGAGKTLITALMCRHLAREGVDVAPFKSQNISLNSYVTEDGREIGISQAFQSWACGVEPDWRMNPVLLKPKGNGGCQIVLEGKPYADVGSISPTEGRGLILNSAKRAYSELKKEHDVVVIEGSGSPAEINIKERDIANMATAEMARSPVVLIGDIERGGVFAALFGTHHLIDEPHRRMITGFLINRYRGDPNVLIPGIEILERRMSIPCIGILPYFDLKFPSEDCLDLGRGGELLEMGDVRKSWLRNLDDMLDAAESSIDFPFLNKMIENGL